MVPTLAEMMGHSYDELTLLLQEKIALLRELEAMLDFVGSRHGEREIKRLKADLSAIRSKYLAIRGTQEERIERLAYTQGRESQLREQLDLYENADSRKKDLTRTIEIVNDCIARKKSEKKQSR